MLSVKDDQEVLALARRINAEEKDPAVRMRIDDLMRKIEACRRDGYGYTEGATTPGAGIIAVLLPTPPHQPPIALGIGAALRKLRYNMDFIQFYLILIKRYWIKLPSR